MKFMASTGRTSSQILIILPWVGLWVASSQALSYLLSGSLHELHIPPFPSYGGVLISLELAVVIGELVVEDGNGHPVEDDRSRQWSSILVNLTKRETVG